MQCSGEETDWFYYKSNQMYSTSKLVLCVTTKGVYISIFHTLDDARRGEFVHGTETAEVAVSSQPNEEEVVRSFSAKMQR